MDELPNRSEHIVHTSPVSLESALKEVGGHHAYQRRVFIVLANIWLAYALFLEGLVFLLLSYEESLRADEEE
ncbi:MAG: hypothetical protein V2I33_25720 [Kangiellaceae bacterium]|jgi:hypothetical protein|nr:hypothetical protein [Kangiellaceae bacterium]